MNQPPVGTGVPDGPETKETNCVRAHREVYRSVKSRRLLPSRLRRATSLSEGGICLFYHIGNGRSKPLPYRT